jgi:hypothetical protein
MASSAAEASPGQPNLDQLWSQIVDAVGRASPFTRSYLLEAHPVSFTRNLLTIGFDPEFADHLELVDNAKNRTLIQTKLKELGYAETMVKFIKAEAPRGPGTPAPGPGDSAPPPPPSAPDRRPSNGARAAPALPGEGKPEQVPLSKDQFKNDPLIQKALELFKGQIVEVRT